MLYILFSAIIVLLGVGIENVLGYWLMGASNVLTTQRIDPIAIPGSVGKHVHDVLGGSNFGFNLSTARLRQSECSSIPVSEDKSNYWYPKLYFWWRNGSFTSVVGNPVILHSFLDIIYTANAPGPQRLFLTTYVRRFSLLDWRLKKFFTQFRMISGDPTIRTFDPSSFAQQAVTHLCLDFQGKSERFNELPLRRCPSGIRSQINFPSCWNGKDVDSPDHKSHVSFLSTGPDNGTCSSSEYPITLPRIFLEVYWYTQEFDTLRNKAMVPQQPFVLSNGDPNGYSFHADFYNGWEPGVLQRALDECNCNPYGDPSCCVARGIFTLNQTKKCFVTDTVFEQTSGTLASLPGANPVQKNCYEEFTDNVSPPLLSPVYMHNGTEPTPSNGAVAVPARTARAGSQREPRGTCVWKSSAADTLNRVGKAKISVYICASLILISFLGLGLP